MRREHSVEVTINGRTLRRLIIDSHYEIRHSGSITDSLILSLVKLLDGEEREIETVTSSGFEIFRVDPVYFGGKAYRLVLTLPPCDQENSDYLGVINVFRVHGRKRNRKE